MKLAGLVRQGLSSIFVWIVLSSCATAETLVLVHGYLGGADSWRTNGVTEVLEQHGWRDGGHLTAGSQGVSLRGPDNLGSRRFYTLNLPTQSSLLTQANQLSRYLVYLRTCFPNTALILAGHSAGGVVARLTMVQQPDVGVTTLITIASPHLGTESAEIGLALSQSPLGWFAPLVGAGALNRSQELYRDLARENLSNILYWLNRQPHPAAVYTSIVRGKDHRFHGFSDLFMTTFSQDMNHVYSLRGRVQTIATSGPHGLRADDGTLIVKILSSLNRV